MTLKTCTFSSSTKQESSHTVNYYNKRRTKYKNKHITLKNEGEVTDNSFMVGKLLLFAHCEKENETFFLIRMWKHSLADAF